MIHILQCAKFPLMQILPIQIGAEGSCFSAVNMMSTELTPPLCFWGKGSRHLRGQFLKFLMRY